jgi:hypothetical protein
LVASSGQLIFPLMVSRVSKPETAIAKLLRSGVIVHSIPLFVRQRCDSRPWLEQRRVAKMQYASDIFFRLPIRGMDEHAPDRRRRPQ